MKYLLLIAFACLSAGCVSNAPIESREFAQIEKPTSGLLVEEFDLRSNGSGSAAFQTPPKRALTDAGLELLKTFEGEVRCETDSTLHCPYNDSAKYCTIGHGHLIKKASCESMVEELSSLGYLDGISDDDATGLLVADLRTAQLALESKMGSDELLDTVAIDENQYDALVSFIFNVGAGAFHRSTLLRRIRARELLSGNADVEQEFSRWVRAGGVVSRGLVARRKKEAAHFFADHGLPSVINPETAAFRLEPLTLIDIQTGEEN